MLATSISASLTLIGLLSLLAPQFAECIPLRTKRAFSYIANETACTVDHIVYRDGDPIPTDDACETCRCRPPGFSCVLRECEVKTGCRAIRRIGECCPLYQCGCEHNGNYYRDGERIPNAESPCYSCYCQGSSITCSLADCKFRFDCEPEYVPGECCPRYDHCPPEEQENFVTVKSTEIPRLTTAFMSSHSSTTTSTTTVPPITFTSQVPSTVAVVENVTESANRNEEPLREDQWVGNDTSATVSSTTQEAISASTMNTSINVDIDQGQQWTTSTSTLPASDSSPTSSSMPSEANIVTSTVTQTTTTSPSTVATVEDYITTEKWSPTTESVTQISASESQLGKLNETESNNNSTAGQDIALTVSTVSTVLELQPTEVTTSLPNRFEVVEPLEIIINNTLEGTTTSSTESSTDQSITVPVLVEDIEASNSTFTISSEQPTTSSTLSTGWPDTVPPLIISNTSSEVSFEVDIDRNLTFTTEPNFTNEEKEDKVSSSESAITTEPDNIVDVIQLETTTTTSGLVTAKSSQNIEEVFEVEPRTGSPLTELNSSTNIPEVTTTATDNVDQLVSEVSSLTTVTPLEAVNNSVNLITTTFELETVTTLPTSINISLEIDSTSESSLTRSNDTTEQATTESSVPVSETSTEINLTIGTEASVEVSSAEPSTTPIS